MNRDDRLARLEHDRDITRQTFLTILEQLAELNLRMLFTMEHFKLQRPAAGGLILEGKLQMEVKTLYQIYVESGRDAMLNLIEQRQQEIAAALAAAQEQINAEGSAEDTGTEVGAEESGAEAAATGAAPRILDFAGHPAEAGR